MTLEECYRQLGGDYADACTRLPTPALVARFIAKFPADPSFAALCDAVAGGDAAAAFAAAHTLKGVCANLSFRRLFGSASALTETLRGQTSLPEQTASLLDEVRTDYEVTVEAIRQFTQG